MHLRGEDKWLVLQSGGGLETFSHKNAPGDWHYYWKSEYLHGINNVTGTLESIPAVRENVLDIEALGGYNLSEKFRINIGAAAQFSRQMGSGQYICIGAVSHLFPHVVLNGKRYKIAAGVKSDIFYDPTTINWASFHGLTPIWFWRTTGLPSLQK